MLRNSKKLRVVYVDWNAELPKPERGITYLRPNKEPVIFPGEYGYEGDYSLQEWSLSEEVAGDEYLDNEYPPSLPAGKQCPWSDCDHVGSKQD